METHSSTDRFEDFDLLHVIGKGSFGEVRLCKLKSSVGDAALVMKQINMGSMSPEETEACSHEVEVLAQLQHPNIVRYHQSFVHTGSLCIIMEYCRGGDLQHRLQALSKIGKPVEENVAVSWIAQITLALQYCHDRRILHRDIKPSNIYLTGEGAVKLGDFGVARELGRTADMASTVVGTPYAMAPELCQSLPYSYKSDVWGLGCMFYEILTFKHAFEGSSLLNLVWKIVQDKVPPIPTHYSADVQALLDRMLTKDPDRRADLNEIMNSPPVLRVLPLFGTTNNTVSPSSGVPISVSQIQHAVMSASLGVSTTTSSTPQVSPSTSSGAGSAGSTVVKPDAGTVSPHSGLAADTVRTPLVRANSLPNSASNTEDGESGCVTAPTRSPALSPASEMQPSTAHVPSPSTSVKQSSLQIRVQSASSSDLDPPTQFRRAMTAPLSADNSRSTSPHHALHVLSNIASPSALRAFAASQSGSGSSKSSANRFFPPQSLGPGSPSNALNKEASAVVAALLQKHQERQAVSVPQSTSRSASPTVDSEFSAPVLPTPVPSTAAQLSHQNLNLSTAGAGAGVPTPRLNIAPFLSPMPGSQLSPVVHLPSGLLTHPVQNLAREQAAIALASSLLQQNAASSGHSTPHSSTSHASLPPARAGQLHSDHHRHSSSQTLLLVRPASGNATPQTTSPGPHSPSVANQHGLSPQQSNRLLSPPTLHHANTSPHQLQNVQFSLFSQGPQIRQPVSPQNHAFNFDRVVAADSHSSVGPGSQSRVAVGPLALHALPMSHGSAGGSADPSPRVNSQRLLTLSTAETPHHGILSLHPSQQQAHLPSSNHTSPTLRPTVSPALPMSPRGRISGSNTPTAHQSQTLSAQHHTRSMSDRAVSPSHAQQNVVRRTSLRTPEEMAQINTIRQSDLSAESPSAAVQAFFVLANGGSAPSSRQNSRPSSRQTSIRPFNGKPIVEETSNDSPLSENPNIAPAATPDQKSGLAGLAAASAAAASSARTVLSPTLLHAASLNLPSSTHAVPITGPLTLPHALAHTTSASPLFLNAPQTASHGFLATNGTVSASPHAPGATSPHGPLSLNSASTPLSPSQLSHLNHLHQQMINRSANQVSREGLVAKHSLSVGQAVDDERPRLPWSMTPPAAVAVGSTVASSGPLSLTPAHAQAHTPSALNLGNRVALSALNSRNDISRRRSNESGMVSAVAQARASSHVNSSLAAAAGSRLLARAKDSSSGRADVNDQADDDDAVMKAEEARHRSMMQRQPSSTLSFANDVKRNASFDD